jgi:hypothetical protein
MHSIGPGKHISVFLDSGIKKGCASKKERKVSELNRFS